MSAWLFGNQETTPAAVRQAAATILAVTDFDKEYQQKLVDIRRDVADGGVLRIQSTPTFFINGVRLEGSIKPEYFEMAINLELKKAS
jgi:protein-disulfide isomerase